MADIFREIDEELRQERYEKLWKAYGKYLIVAAVALVAGFAGWRAWEHYRLKQRQHDSAQFVAAVALQSNGKKEEAASLFAALAERGTPGYQVLARFRQAALRVDNHDIVGAIAVYNAIAADTEVSSVLREAAVVFAVMHEIDQPDVNLATLKARLDPLIRPDGPWRHSARELAGLLALKQGDTEAAKKQFTALVDDIAAPSNMRARATQILAVLGS